MTIQMLKGKIHRAVVVQAELNYVGSITVDPELMDAAGICEYEKVDGDLRPEEGKNHKPSVGFVDEKNHIKRVASYEKHGELSD